MNEYSLDINDEPNILANTTTFLTLNKCVVETATDRQAKLGKYKQSQPDLIIGNTLMPVMAGLDLVERLPQTSGLQTTPFIFFSPWVTPPATISYYLLINLLLTTTGTILPTRYATGSLSITTRLVQATVGKIEQCDDLGQHIEVNVEEANLPFSERASQKYLEEIIPKSNEE